MIRVSADVVLYSHGQGADAKSFNHKLDFSNYAPFNVTEHDADAHSNLADTNTAITDMQSKRATIYFKQEHRGTEAQRHRAHYFFLM